MEDVETLAKHFNDKYGFQCYQIAIHRDEGHIDEDGKKQINHHAHLEFITLDKESGKNNYRRELITPNILRRIQTETAEILQMQRGKATEKAVVEVIKAIDDNEEKLLSSKEKSEYLEQLRKQYKDKGLSAEFFRELGVLKKDKETKYTQKELDEAIQKAVEADRKNKNRSTAKNSSSKPQKS